MKKFLVLFFALLFTVPAFAVSTDYREIFEKTYLNINRIELLRSYDVVSFWVKSLNKEPNNKDLWFPNVNGTKTQWWYNIANIQIDCKNNKSRTLTMAIYDLKNHLLDTSEEVSEWSTIIPDTYADGYYRLFCIVPYDENPLLNPSLRD